MANGIRQTNSGIVQTESGVAQTEIAASNISLIDSWEDDDFAEWSNVSADWSTQTAFATDGSIGGQYSSSTGDIITRTTAEGSAGLPAQGHIQKVDWESNISAANATGVEVRWRFAEGTNWYEVHHDLTDSRLEVWLRGNTNSRFISVAADYAADTHYETEIIWDDGSLGGSAGDFTVTVTDVAAGTTLASGSGNDTTLTGPGDVKIDMRRGEQGTIEFDYWRITNA